MKLPSHPRRTLLLAVVAVVVALAVGAWLLWPRTAITRENAAKIKRGMTLAEVEAILGGPEREEGEGYPVPSLGPRPPTWATPSLAIYVWMDGDKRVLRVSEFYDDESLVAILRRWLRL